MNLRKAVNKRLNKKGIEEIQEKLEKAKYIKRTGGPGRYKYIYKEKAGRGKDKRYGPKDKVDLKTHGVNFKKMTSEMIGMLKRGVNPRTTKGRAEIKKIDAKYENKVNTYPAGEYADMWKNKETWLKEIVPGKGKSKEEIKIDKNFEGRFKELVNDPDYDSGSYDAQIPGEYMGEAIEEKMELCSVNTSKWTDQQDAFMEDLESYLVNDYGLAKEKVPPLSLIEREMKKIDNNTYKLQSEDYSGMSEKEYLKTMSG